MKTTVVVAVGVVTLGLAAWGRAAPLPPTLDIREFRFEPSTVTVMPGTTVTWVNHDEETHTVTSATGAFTSPPLDREQTFAHTFSQSGTYTYFCALHPHMRATIVVKGER